MLKYHSPETYISYNFKNLIFFFFQCSIRGDRMRFIFVCVWPIFGNFFFFSNETIVFLSHILNVLFQFFFRKDPRFIFEECVCSEWFFNFLRIDWVSVQMNQMIRLLNILPDSLLNFLSKGSIEFVSNILDDNYWSSLFEWINWASRKFSFIFPFERIKWVPV